MARVARRRSAARQRRAGAARSPLRGTARRPTARPARASARSGPSRCRPCAPATSGRSPPRDRGPVKRYARDLVDARRSVAEFFLPLALIILVLTFTGSTRLNYIGSTLWLVLVVLIFVDSIVLTTRLKRGLRRSFPDENHRGAVPYVLMRSMQIRRFRLPPPRVKAGRRR